MWRQGEAPSWRISVDQWNLLYDVALWVRAAERIDVPAGGTVPGPLDIDPLPEPTTGTDSDLAEGWLRWWQTITGQPRWPSGRAAAGKGISRPPPQVQFIPPDFPGLARWPALQRVLAQRWPEADRWHTERKTAGVRHLHHHRPSAGESRIVSNVERELGRPVPAFDIEFVVVPVRDTQIRQLTDTRYLVPEAIYGGPNWTGWLRALVLRLAS